MDEERMSFQRQKILARVTTSNNIHNNYQNKNVPYHKIIRYKYCHRAGCTDLACPDVKRMKPPLS